MRKDSRVFQSSFLHVDASLLELARRDLGDIDAFRFVFARIDAKGQLFAIFFINTVTAEDPALCCHLLFEEFRVVVAVVDVRVIVFGVHLQGTVGYSTLAGKDAVDDGFLIEGIAQERNYVGVFLPEGRLEIGGDGAVIGRLEIIDGEILVVAEGFGVLRIEPGQIDTTGFTWAALAFSSGIILKMILSILGCLP